MTAVLHARGISVRFGGVHALSDVELELEPHRITGLIGPNGAGKTTFIDAISGFVSCEGSVELGSEDVSRLSACERARRGMRRTWQAAELFDDLTVAENLSVAARGGSLRALAPWRRHSSDVGPDSSDLIELLGLQACARRYPNQLSEGQRKLVGVARALVGRPQVALLDEPAAGLDTQESLGLGAHLEAIAASGPAVLLVDHDMGLVLSVCQEVVVLDFGRVVARGTPDEIRRDPAVIAAYIGGEDAELAIENGASA